MFQIFLMMIRASVQQNVEEISISSIILCQYLNDRYLVCVNSLISKQNVLLLSIFIDSSGSDVFQGTDRLMYWLQTSL